MNLLISDLDGTLVDTFPDLYASALESLKRFHVSPLFCEPSCLRAKAGTSAWELLYALAGEKIVGLREEIVFTMIEIYKNRLTRESRPFPGTQSWFHFFTIAVVTNKPRELAEPILHHFFPKKYALLLTPDDTGEKKPSPLPYRQALDRLGEKSALVVGDDRRDYEAASPMNLPFVIAAYGYSKEEEWQEYPSLPRIHTPADLLTIAPSLGLNLF
jgi:phosphoglycolate phosphatase